MPSKPVGALDSVEAQTRRRWPQFPAIGATVDRNQTRHQLKKLCDECPFIGVVTKGLVDWGRGAAPEREEEWRLWFSRDQMRCHKTLQDKLPEACAGFKGAAAIVLGDAFPELRKTYAATMKKVRVPGGFRLRYIDNREEEQHKVLLS